MITGNKWISTGLMFDEYREFDIVDVANRLMSNLEALDQRVANVYIVSEQCTLVTTSDYQFRIGIEDDVDLERFATRAKTYVSVGIRGMKVAPGSATSTLVTLVKALKTLHRSMQPDHVKWIGDGIVIRGDDFLAATRTDAAGVEAEKTQTPVPHYDLPAVEDTNDRLQQQLIERQAGVYRRHATGPSAASGP